MIKQILILLILSVTCFWGKASNNDNGDFHGDISSPAVRNNIKFNYDQIAGIKNNEQNNYSDDFNLPQLRSLWQSNISDCDWTLKERPGYLRIKSQKFENCDGFLPEKTFSQKVKFNTSGEAVIFIDLINLSEDSKAGLYLSSKSVSYIGVESVNGGNRLFVQVNNEIERGPEISENSVMLRLKFENTKAWYEYSVNGEVFFKLGSEFQLSSISNGNDYIGLYCLNETREKGSVDIDWFYYNPRKDNAIKFAENKSENIYPEL